MNIQDYEDENINNIEDVENIEQKRDHDVENINKNNIRKIHDVEHIKDSIENAIHIKLNGNETGSKIFLEIPSTFEEKYLGQYFKRYEFHPTDNVFRHQFLQRCNNMLEIPLI